MTAALIARVNFSKTNANVREMCYNKEWNIIQEAQAMLSMTGYGRATVERDGRQLTVELKSVNHRFLDLAFRMPRNLAFLEEDARRAIGAPLARGHVDVFMTYRNPPKRRADGFGGYCAVRRVCQRA